MKVVLIINALKIFTCGTFATVVLRTNPVLSFTRGFKLSMLKICIPMQHDFTIKKHTYFLHIFHICTVKEVIFGDQFSYRRTFSIFMLFITEVLSLQNSSDIIFEKSRQIIQKT